MNILITGIAGFVGKYLVEYLLKRDKNVKIFGTYLAEKDSPGSSNNFSQVKFYQCDISNRLEVDGVIRASRPDYIYHLAAMSSGSESDRKKVFNVNVGGTVNILQSCKIINKKIRILLASTSYIYGSSKNCLPFKESDPENPVGIYAESKLAMEQRAEEFLSDKIEIVISRAFNHTGPGQTENFVVPAFAKQIAEIEKRICEPIIKVGNLDAVRDFLDVRDVTRAYYVLIKKGESGEIYNIASGGKYRIREILDRLLSLSGEKINIIKDRERMRPSDIACSVGSYEKIKKEFGWEPKIDFSETLKLTLDYWRSKI